MPLVRDGPAAIPPAAHLSPMKRCASPDANVPRDIIAIRVPQIQNRRAPRTALAAGAAA